MKSIRALFSVCLALFLSSPSWSWWEWRERRVGTGTDVSPQQPGFGSDRQSACWIGTRGRIRTTKIFVIVKFHVVTKTNTRYSGVINTCINIRSLSLSYIVPSAKRFVRPYSGQPTRKGNSYQVPGMKLILSWRTAYALKCRCSRCPLTLLSLST